MVCCCLTLDSIKFILAGNPKARQLPIPLALATPALHTYHGNAADVMGNPRERFLGSCKSPAASNFQFLAEIAFSCLHGTLTQYLAHGVRIPFSLLVPISSQGRNVQEWTIPWLVCVTQGLRAAALPRPPLPGGREAARAMQQDRSCTPGAERSGRQRGPELRAARLWGRPGSSRPGEQEARLAVRRLLLSPPLPTRAGAAQPSPGAAFPPIASARHARKGRHGAGTTQARAAVAAASRCGRPMAVGGGPRWPTTARSSATSWRRWSPSTRTRSRVRGRAGSRRAGGGAGGRGGAAAGPALFRAARLGWVLGVLVRSPWPGKAKRWMALVARSVGAALPRLAPWQPGVGKPVPCAGRMLFGGALQKMQP